MPVYEFECNNCSARVSYFVRTINSDVSPQCDRCGATDLRRLVSKFAVVRAPFDASKLDKRELLDGVDYSNPTSMANFFRRMGNEFQDDQNDYMDEIIGRLDHGEDVAKTLGIEEHNHDHGDAFSVGSED